MPVPPYKYSGCMAERALDESLNYLKVSLEEKRVLKILLAFGKPVDADQIKKEYQRLFKVKIGNRIYYILGNLKDKEYVSTSKDRKKLFYCNSAKIAKEIRESLEKEQKKIQKTMEKMEFLSGKPSLTTHVGSKSVAELFEKIVSKLKEGCEFHTIMGTMRYPIRPEKPIKTKILLKQDMKIRKFLIKNRKSGKLIEYHIIDKNKYIKDIKNLEKEFGKKYIKKTFNEMIDSLKLKNFNVIFGKDLEFKFFVIPNYCAVTAWFSSPKQYYLDRAIAFWYPDDIKGLDEHFWFEWRRILGNRTEEEAKEEVKKWARKLLKRI